MKCRLSAIILLTLSGCFLCASPAWAQVTKIKVGYSSIGVGQSLVWVAKEAGLFKENGLDLQLIFIGSSSIVTQAVIAGDVPIAIMSGSTAINSQLRGSRPRDRGEHQKGPGPGVSGHRERNFSACAAQGEKAGGEPAGRVIGFYPQGDSQEIGLVPDKDVAIIQVGSSPVRMAALANGVADGTALTFEEMMVAKKMGFNVLMNLMDFGVEALNSDVVTTRRFIRESRDTVQRFIKGMIKGVSFFAANKKFSMDVIARYTKSTDMEKIEYGYDFVAKTFLKKPYTPIKGVQLALEEIGERNPVAKTANPEQFIDMSMVKELDQSGYIDALYK